MKKIVRCNKARLNCVEDCPHKESHIKTEMCDHMQSMAEEFGCGECIDIGDWYWMKGKHILKCLFLFVLILQLISLFK